MWNKQDLGHGIGLRKEHFLHLLEHGPSGIDWFEVISENFFEMGGRPWKVLERVRQDVPIVMHGVSMAIGNTDELDWDYLKRLKRLADAVEPAWVSDHICWGGFGGHNAHDLLPLPYTEETVAHLVSRIQQVQDFLKRPMMFENVSSYVTFCQSEMTEWEFVTEVATRSGSGILLDVNNIYVSAYNHGFQIEDYLDGVPAAHIGQFHIAGHTNYGDYIIDTHIGPTIQEVWDVYRKAVERFGRTATLIEWDSELPPYEDVVAESQIAARIEKEVLGEAPQTRPTSATLLEPAQQPR